MPFESIPPESTVFRFSGCFSILRRVALVAAAALVVASTFTMPALADDVALEARFISMLPRFIDWPEGSFDSQSAPILVGVLGEDPFDGSLSEVLAEASAQGRHYELRPVTSVEDVSGLHILIITETNRTSLRKLARQLKGESVLTIARSFPFAEDGGIVGMEIYRGKVAFEVNNRTAKKSNIKISSKLLRLASNVY